MVGAGGFIGSVLRYMVSGYVQELSQSVDFPYGTVAVNLIGCLVIGILTHLVEEHGVFVPETRALLFIGVLGGFTTFSTFGNETLNLLRDGETFLAMISTGVQVVFGLGAVWLGRTLSFLVWG